MEGAKAKDEVALSVAIDASAAKEDAGHKRASRSRLAAMIGGLALVGAAVGLVGVGLSNSADSSTTKAAAPSYSADLIGAEVVTAAGVKGGPARGKADLDVHNVLTWALRKLEPETSGTIHLHAGTSCNALGSSHWDTEVTSSNPWTEVTWSSDSAGKSEGTLNIDELVGAYSFPANLRHAVVFYSHDQQVLACGLLKPEGDYRKFGVQSVLNNGFEEHQSNAVAGEVILSKANVLSWGVYNLQAEQSGVVSVLAGRDCSNPDATWFTTEWSTDKWGTSRSEAAIDSAEHDFSDLVGRAVVIRNADGAVVACNTLSVFVEKTPAAIRAIRAELQDIVEMYKSDGYVPPVPLEKAVTVLRERISKAKTCFGLATETIFSYRPQYEEVVDFVNNNYEAYLAATEAQEQNISTPEQDSLIAEYKSKRFSAGRIRSQRNRAVSRIGTYCYKAECLEARKAFVSNETAFGDAAQQLDLREAEFAAAVDAVAGGTATQEQQVIAGEYNVLVEQQQVADTNLEQLVATIMEQCPEDSWCTFESNRFPSGSCTQLTACNNEKYRVAEQGSKYEAVLHKLFGLKRSHRAALEAQAIGNATEEQQALIAEHSILERDEEVLGSSFRQSKAALDNDPLCASPAGSVTLSSDNVLSWELTSLLPSQKGHIMILEEKSCFGSDLGGQVALPDTTPFATVYWDTTDDNGTSDEGSVDLSTLAGALPYQDNHPRTVVVFTEDNEEVACGELKEVKTL